MLKGFFLYLNDNNGIIKDCTNHQSFPFEISQPLIQAAIAVADGNVPTRSSNYLPHYNAMRHVCNIIGIPSLQSTCIRPYTHAISYIASEISTSYTNNLTHFPKYIGRYAKYALCIASGVNDVGDLPRPAREASYRLTQHLIDPNKHARPANIPDDIIRRLRTLMRGTTLHAMININRAIKTDFPKLEVLSYCM